MRWFSKNNDARSSNQFFNLVPIPWTTHCLAFLFRQMSHVKRKLFNSFFATLSSFQNNQKEMKWNGENQALFHTCKKPSHNLCFLVIIGTIFLLLCFSFKRSNLFAPVFLSQRSEKMLQIRWSGFTDPLIWFFGSNKKTFSCSRGGTIILTFDARGRDFLQFSIAHEMKEERNKGTFLKTSLRIQRWNWFGKKIRQSLPQGNFSCLLLLIQK